MTLPDAIDYVKTYAQTGEFPCLDDTLVQQIVERNQRASVWTAPTDYNAGDRIQPTTRNGHFYECVVPGTSSTDEPDWCLKMDSLTQETDSDLVWREVAIDIDGNLYNLRNAVHEAWLLKASRSVSEFDVSIDQQSWERSQIHDHCKEMTDKWTPYD